MEKRLTQDEYVTEIVRGRNKIKIRFQRYPDKAHLVTLAEMKSLDIGSWHWP